LLFFTKGYIVLLNCALDFLTLDAAKYHFVKIHQEGVFHNVFFLTEVGALQLNPWVSWLV